MLARVGAGAVERVLVSVTTEPRSEVAPYKSGTRTLSRFRSRSNVSVRAGSYDIVALQETGGRAEISALSVAAGMSWVFAEGIVRAIHPWSLALAADLFP